MRGFLHWETSRGVLDAFLQALSEKNTTWRMIYNFLDIIHTPWCSHHRFNLYSPSPPKKMWYLAGCYKDFKNQFLINVKLFPNIYVNCLKWKKKTSTPKYCFNFQFQKKKLLPVSSTTWQGKVGRRTKKRREEYKLIEIQLNSAFVGEANGFAADTYTLAYNDSNNNRSSQHSAFLLPTLTPALR